MSKSSPLTLARFVAATLPKPGNRALAHRQSFHTGSRRIATQPVAPRSRFFRVIVPPWFSAI